MPPRDAAADNQLLYRACPPDHPDAGPALPWDEQVPSLGQNATLLAATSTARSRRDAAHERDATHEAAEYLVWHTGL